MSTTEKKQGAGRYYYSTYSSDIYAEGQHSSEDVSARKHQGKHVEDKTRHWSLNVLFNTRMLIIISSVIISSVLFSYFSNQDPDPENFQIGRVLAPPNIFDIKELQIPSVGSSVNKRIIFEGFLTNLKTAKVAEKFSGSEKFFGTLKLRRNRSEFESVDSVMISVETKNPELAAQWLDGYMSFVGERTVNDFVKITQRKIDDKKDRVVLDIDTTTKEAQDGNSELALKVDKYAAALKKSLEKGIINSIAVSDVPENERFGDLLYLQGSWKLEAELKRLNTIMKNQVVDTSVEEAELKALNDIVLDTDKLKSFQLESVADVTVLNASNKQMLMNIFGAIVGLVVGVIISFPFRRKKVK